MIDIDKEIAEIDAGEEGADFEYSKVARKLKVDRNTLQQRHQGVQALRDA
jgi:hypothetical protein